MKIHKIILSILIISIIGKSAFADDQLDVKNNVNYMRGGSVISGIFGDILTKIFDTDGKIKVTFMSLLGLNDLSDVIINDYSMFMGSLSGLNSTGNWNTSIGVSSMLSNTGGTENTAVGSETLLSNTIGSANTAIGSSSLGSNITGDLNTALGSYALYYNESGSNNISIGASSMTDTLTGSNNTVIGYEALTNTNNSNNNVVVGAGSMFWCLNGCNYNTSVGFESLNNNDGSGNVALGYQAGYTATGSNKLYIDNSSTSTPLIYGDFSTNKLTINGSLKIGVATDTTCNSTNEGSIRYDSTGKHFYGCNGTSWLQLDN